jgi:hypothetical protein
MKSEATDKMTEAKNRLGTEKKLHRKANKHATMLASQIAATVPNKGENIISQ